MPPSELVTIASEAAHSLSQTSSRRAFVKSTRKILDALSLVPDYAYSAFSSKEIDQLQLTAEQAIATIDLRIETRNDGQALTLELAQAIYELRRELEENRGAPDAAGILVLLTEGLSNAEIAERLGVSEKTVRNHVSNLFDKLGVWTRAQAMVFARDRGFKADTTAAHRREKV